jgi:hypothetical protein
MTGVGPEECAAGAPAAIITHRRQHGVRRRSRVDLGTVKLPICQGSVLKVSETYRAALRNVEPVINGVKSCLDKHFRAVHVDLAQWTAD